MSTDWLAAMREAAWLDAATVIDEADEAFTAPVSWQRIETPRGRLDVQTIESSRLGRRLLILELDIGDVETEQRIRQPIGARTHGG